MASQLFNFYYYVFCIANLSTSLTVCKWWTDCHFVDLTRPLARNIPLFPNAPKFHLVPIVKGLQNGYYAYANKFCMGEHTGTHLDAPAHFANSEIEANSQATIDMLSIKSLIGEACIIDLEQSKSATLSTFGILRWERENGRISDDCILLIRSGSTKKENGLITRETVQWLLNRGQVKVFGTDALSIDNFNSTIIHRLLFKQGVPVLEGLVNLEKLPPRGATVIALPLNIRGGSGAPVRVIAYTGESCSCKSSAMNRISPLQLLGYVALIWFIL